LRLSDLVRVTVIYVRCCGGDGHGGVRRLWPQLTAQEAIAVKAVRISGCAGSRGRNPSCVYSYGCTEAVGCCRCERPVGDLRSAAHTQRQR
jgi:hypothetical protein